MLSPEAQLSLFPAGSDGDHARISSAVQHIALVEEASGFLPVRAHEAHMAFYLLDPTYDMRRGGIAKYLSVIYRHQLITHENEGPLAAQTYASTTVNRLADNVGEYFDDAHAARLGLQAVQGLIDATVNPRVSLADILRDTDDEAAGLGARIITRYEDLRKYIAAGGKYYPGYDPIDVSYRYQTAAVALNARVATMAARAKVGHLRGVLPRIANQELIREQYWAERIVQIQKAGAVPPDMRAALWERIV